MNSATHPSPVHNQSGPLPVVAGLAWLALLGILIWLHAREAVEPPIYDAMTYFQKAHAVWASLASGHLQNPLNIAPSFRPPGTLLVSAPFGFSEDFRGFLFRSVFWPVALVFGAVILANHPLERTWPRPSVVLAAGFWSTISLFYYFEPYVGGPPAVSHWGLVDSFLTGLAALSTACALRSAAAMSLRWGIASLGLGILMIFVKPSGVVLTALVDLVMAALWLQSAVIEWKRTGSRSIWKRLAVLFILEAFLSGCAVLVAMRSAYLGPGNMAFGISAIAVMRAELSTDFATLFPLVHSAIGYLVPVGSLLLFLLWATRRVFAKAASRGRSDDVQIALAVLVLLFGIWFWIFGSGGATQIRYFVPFLYIFFICGSTPWLRALDASPRFARGAMHLYMLACVVNITLLLALPDPALAWQLFTGVNVKSGSRVASLEQARQVLAETPPDVRAISVYSFTFGISDAVFESVFKMHAMTTPTPALRQIRAIDWLRPSTFRIEDIIDADYLLFDPEEDSPPPTGLPHDVDSLAGEIAVFHYWVGHLSLADGVVPVASATDSAVLHVTDRVALRASLAKLIAEHQWRPLFIASNPPRWWSAPGITQALTEAVASQSDVRFGDQFELHSVLVKRAADGELILEAWLRPTAAVPPGNWAISIHTMDAQGKLLTQNDVYIGRVEPPPDAASYWYVHTQFRPAPATAQVAVGIYDGDLRLLADRGTRNPGHAELLLNLPER